MWGSDAVKGNYYYACQCVYSWITFFSSGVMEILCCIIRLPQWCSQHGDCQNWCLVGGREGCEVTAEIPLPPSCWCHSSVKVCFKNIIYKLFSIVIVVINVCSPSTWRVTGDAIVIWRCNGPKCGLLYYRVKLNLPFISSLTLRALFKVCENGNNNSIYSLHRVDMRVG